MYSEGPCEQKPIKNFGENRAWAYIGTAQIFWVPPIISGTDKATNFKFCTHIHSIDQNNSPLKISGAVAGCIVRTLKTFKCTHILGASRGLLSDSYAVLFQLRPHISWVWDPLIWVIQLYTGLGYPETEKSKPPCFVINASNINRFLADTAASMIGYWYGNVFCRSVCPTVCSRTG